MEERERLATIRRFGLVVSKPEPVLDRITAIVAELFDVPIVLITIVDETKQFVKASFGIDMPALPREFSFCAETIRGDDVVVVPDLAEHGTFNGNPLVVGEPKLRFYAAAPLAAPDGMNLGTLCLLDWKPRTLEPQQVARLAEFSKLVVEQFELHRKHLKATEDRNKVQAVIEASPTSIVTALVDGTITSWNDAAEALFGWSRAEAVGRKPDMVPMELWTESSRIRKGVMKGHFVRGHRTYRLGKDGERIEVELSAGPVRDAAGRIVEVVLMHKDETTRLREQAIERNRYEILELAANDGPIQQLLDRLVANVESAIPGTIGAIARIAGGRVFHAASGAHMPAIYKEMLDGIPLSPNVGSIAAAAFTGEVTIVADIATHPNWAAHRDLALGLGIHAAWSVPIRTANGIVGTLSVYAREPRTPTGAEMRALLESAHVASIVLESHDARVRLEEMALHDALTGLPNRALFEDRLKHAIASAKRREQKFAVGMLDIDRFKMINDTLGHAVGDQLLQEVASRLHRALRAHDTVARMGGDEFLILLVDIDDRDTVREIAARALDSLSTTFAPEGNELFVRASLGFSIYPDDAIEPSQLLRLADRAMYDAKASRSSVAFFDSMHAADNLTQLTLEMALNQALDKNELVLMYQPIVRCADWATVGAETLLRWNHPSLGLLPPGRFISLAEETGLIIPIGAWLLREACSFATHWRRAGGAGRISVNVSPRQFEDRAFLETVQGALQASGIEPGFLTLEITETLIMRSPETAAATLAELRRIGVRCEIDDFGSGYSSLNYLKRFPIDALKIDRAFVAEIGTGSCTSSDEAIIRAIVAMGGALGLAVVAEGVETEIQANFVRTAGCDFAQGYLFARPMNGRALLARGSATIREETAF